MIQLHSTLVCDQPKTTTPLVLSFNNEPKPEQEKLLDGEHLNPKHLDNQMFSFKGAFKLTMDTSSDDDFSSDDSELDLECQQVTMTPLIIRRNPVPESEIHSGELNPMQKLALASRPLLSTSTIVIDDEDCSSDGTIDFNGIDDESVENYEIDSEDKIDSVVAHRATNSLFSESESKVQSGQIEYITPSYKISMGSHMEHSRTVEELLQPKMDLHTILVPSKNKSGFQFAKGNQDQGHPEESQMSEKTMDQTPKTKFKSTKVLKNFSSFFNQNALEELPEAEEEFALIW